MIHDMAGFLFIELGFILSLILGYILLKCFSLNKKIIVCAILLSAILHFLGAIAYWHIASGGSADANWYFNQGEFSNPSRGYIGVDFVIRLVYWLRHLLFGSSYLGTYSFFAMVGFLGSVIYLILFNKLILDGKFKGAINFSQKKANIFSFLIACWPSAMLWTSNLGKDSLVYFFIAIFFLSLYKLRQTLFALLPLIVSAILFCLIRPYLLIVVFIGFVLWLFLAKKQKGNILTNLFMFAVLLIILLLSYNFLMKYIGLQNIGFDTIVGRAVQQQGYLAAGTHIPLPTQNPNMLIFFLPYLMFANLFLPLFVFAKNIIGMAASVENAVLLFLVIKFIKQYKYWKILSKIEQTLSYMFWYFISGMAVLGLANTNLGLAYREKLMYLPVFLIIICLVLAIDRKFTIAKNI